MTENLLSHRITQTHYITFIQVTSSSNPFVSGAFKSQLRFQEIPQQGFDNSTESKVSFCPDLFSLVKTIHKTWLDFWSVLQSLSPSFQVSKFPSNPRHGFKREAERPRAASDPSDEPLHLMHDEEPQGRAVQLPSKQPGQRHLLHLSSSVRGN